MCIYADIPLTVKTDSRRVTVLYLICLFSFINNIHCRSELQRNENANIIQCKIQIQNCVTNSVSKHQNSMVAGFLKLLCIKGFWLQAKIFWLYKQHFPQWRPLLTLLCSASDSKKEKKKGDQGIHQAKRCWRFWRLIIYYRLVRNLVCSEKKKEEAWGLYYC